jgi:hypothetical protein
MMAVSWRGSEMLTWWQWIYDIVVLVLLCLWDIAMMEVWWYWLLSYWFIAMAMVRYTEIMAWWYNASLYCYIRLVTAVLCFNVALVYWCQSCYIMILFSAGIVVVLWDQLSDSVVACIVLYGRCRDSLSLLWIVMLFCLIITYWLRDNVVYSFIIEAGRF